MARGFAEPQGRVPAAPPPISTLDSTQLDRLTDAVVQRVERRVRIERERRGQ